MITKMTILQVFNWAEPLTYLYIIVAVVVLLSLQVLTTTSKLLRDSGLEFSFVVFDFDGLLKWTATHQKKVGIILFLAACMGVLWAISY